MESVLWRLVYISTITAFSPSVSLQLFTLSCSSNCDFNTNFFATWPHWNDIFSHWIIHNTPFQIKHPDASLRFWLVEIFWGRIFIIGDLFVGLSPCTFLHFHTGGTSTSTWLFRSAQVGTQICFHWLILYSFLLTLSLMNIPESPSLIIAV